MRIALVTLLCTLGGLIAFGGGGPRAWAEEKKDDKKDAKAEVEKELKKFEGTWTFESAEVGGKKLPAEQFEGVTITFEGEKSTVKKDGEVLESATQKLDPSKSPKTIDATVASGEHKGEVVLCIYEIDGDTLKVCFDPEGKKRPTEFKTDSESSTRTLVVHKRVKSKSTGK